MSDGVAISSGVGTTIASDDVAGVHYQRVKLTDGTADSATHLKVCAEDAAHSSGDTGIMALAVRADTAASTAGTDGDYTPLLTDSTGRLHVALTSVEKAEDAAHASGDKGVMLLGVRVDTGASLSGSDGDYTPMQFDSSGNLRVRVAAADSSATLADSAAFTQGTSKSVVVAGLFDDTSTDLLTENDIGVPRVTGNRRLIVTPYESEALHKQQYTSVTGTSSTALTDFGATASKNNYVTSVVVYNSSSTDTFVKLQDGSGGTTFAVIPAPTKGGVAFSFVKPLKQPTANTGLYFSANDSVTTLYITAVGYQA